MKQGQQNYQSYQGMWVGEWLMIYKHYLYSSDYILDDAGCNAVSFICNNGTDLDAGADMVWVNDNIWTSFVSCPGVKTVFP